MTVRASKRVKNVVRFDISTGDAKLITKIVVRAASLLGGFNRLGLAMDLTATHANGCALRLADLLAADDFNFCHDIRGIRMHLNRRTGKIERFLPRFAAAEERA
jgi:hypothetical protein